MRRYLISRLTITYFISLTGRSGDIRIVGTLLFKGGGGVGNSFEWNAMIASVNYCAFSVILMRYWLEESKTII